LLEGKRADYGYAFAIWTGIGLSAEGLRDLMQERGYVYRRPKHDLSAWQEATALAGWAKKSPWRRF